MRIRHQFRLGKETPNEWSIGESNLKVKHLKKDAKTQNPLI